jgi:hypothetical protein
LFGALRYLSRPRLVCEADPLITPPVRAFVPFRFVDAPAIFVFVVTRV